MIRTTKADKAFLYSLQNYTLTAAQLQYKYDRLNKGEHPSYSQNDWQQAVSNNLTYLGYWDWVAEIIK